jgi:predicted PurR-regulated permease PerM
MGPIVALVITAATNATDWYRQVAQLLIDFSKTGADTLNHLPLVGKIMSLGDKFGIDLAVIGERLATTSSGIILNQASNAAANLLDLLFTLAAALFILFFIYRDGERVVSISIVRLAPNIIKARHYVTEIRSITTAVTVGTIFTCCVQGVTAGIGYYFAGLPAPIFYGALTAVAAIVPVVGTGIVWVPLVALVAYSGSYLPALLLAIWCIVFVVLADNAVRPLAIGAAGDIPVLAIVLGAVCGVLTMGLLGLILGPVIFAILMSVWKDIFTSIELIDSADNPLQPPE